LAVVEDGLEALRNHEVEPLEEVFTVQGLLTEEALEVVAFRNMDLAKLQVEVDNSLGLVAASCMEKVDSNHHIIDRSSP
jgi:hypothetical protein